MLLKYFYLLLLQLVLCRLAALKSLYIFSFWSFEISEGILRNQKSIIGLDSFTYQRLIPFAPF